MARTVDVADVIDAQNVSLFQCVVAFMAWLTLFLDGMDTQSIAYVAPAISKDWGLARGALGTAFSSGILGVALGAMIVGPMADRFGRKRVVVSTVGYVALFSFAVTQVPAISHWLTPVVPAASDLNVLTVLRFFAGLGLGAMVPLGVVITNEFAPKRRRAAIVTLMGCGYAIGSALGGVLASKLVPAFGWASQFYAAAAMTLAMAVALWAWLPESIRFLAVRGRAREVAEILGRIAPNLAFDADTEFVLKREAVEEGGTQLRLVRLFTQGRMGFTILVWLSFFMNLLALNYLNNWLPTLTTETGLPAAQALRAAASLQFGGMLGVITLGFLADRFGFYKVLAASFVGAGVFIAAIGLAGADFTRLSGTIFAAGFFNIGSQITLAAFAATLYPTDIRSTGVSWAHGVARVGSIFSVMFAGTMLSLRWPLETMYFLVSIPMFFGCAWILILAALSTRVSAAELGPHGLPA